MSRKSGSQIKKEKLTKLRSESASRPGQLKITTLFSGKCAKTNDTNDKSNEQSESHGADNNGMCYAIWIEKKITSPR